MALNPGEQYSGGNVVDANGRTVIVFSGGGPSSGAVVQAFGHSIMNGFGIADASQRLSSRVATMLGASQDVTAAINGAVLGWPDTSSGPGGISWIAQRAKRYRRRAPWTAGCDVGLLLFGRNDMPQLGQVSLNNASPLPEGLAIYKNALTSAITLLRSSGRFYAGDKTTNLDANIALGTATNWTVVANAAQPFAKRGSGAVSGSVGYITTTMAGAGGAVTLTIDGSYPGSAVCPLYVMFVADPNTTAGTITASGAATGTFDLVQTVNAKPGTCDKQNNFPGLVVWRFMGGAITASNGAPQTLTLTPTTLTGGTWGLAEFGVEAEFPPAIAVFDISKDVAGGSTKAVNADYATWNTGIQAVTAAFDANVVYNPVDALLGGNGTLLSVALNGAITAGSPATGGSLPLVSAAGLPTAGAMFLPFATGEVISWTGISVNSLTGITRGAYGTTAASWGNGSVFWQAPPASIANFNIGGIGDGVHWSERGNSVAAGATFVNVAPLIRQPSRQQSRAGAGRSDLRCVLTSGAEQIMLASSAAGNCLFFGQSILDTATMHDPTTAAAGTATGYTRITAQADGLYHIVVRGTFSSGKRVSSGAAAAAGMRYLAIAKNAGGVLLGGSASALAEQYVFPTAADQGAFYTTAVNVNVMEELRAGDYVQVFGMAQASAAIGVLTTLTAGINSAVTSIPVFAGTSIVNNDYMRIDDEILLVTAGGGTTTLTATRGQLGTVAAAHLISANIFSGVSVTNATFRMTRIQAI